MRTPQFPRNLINPLHQLTVPDNALGDVALRSGLLFECNSELLILDEDVV